MLRTALTIVRPPTFTLSKASSTIARRYSTPTPPPSIQKNHSINTLPTLPNKKLKIDLRPGPIRPKNTVSSRHPPIKPARPASYVPGLTPNLGSAKEEVVRDITDAEQHGILTPPPADANWFRRTLHQAIQLIVRSFYDIDFLISSLCIRNSTSVV
jgi:hypothetical protein